MDRRSKHLSSEERGVIFAEHERGSSQRVIGAIQCRPASTICRELARGRQDDGSYCPQVARLVCEVRRTRCRRQCKLTEGTEIHRFVQVLGDRTDRLDSHDRDGIAAIVEGQIVLSGVGRLDRNPVARLHGTHKVTMLVVVAIFPDAFTQKTRRLVFRPAVACANKPVGSRSMRGLCHLIARVRH